jgi:hypothetical protein
MLKMLKLLIMMVNSEGEAWLRLDYEFREIFRNIMMSKYSDCFQLAPVVAVRPKDILYYLNHYKPDILHFSGHGDASGHLVFVDDQGLSRPLPINAIKAAFQSLSQPCKIIVLNSCYSEKLSDALKEVVEYATIGMCKPINDRSAISFAAQFYQALGFGCCLNEAFKQAKAALLLEGLSGNTIPTLVCRNGQDPNEIFLLDGANSN